MKKVMKIKFICSTFEDFKKSLEDMEQKSWHGKALIDFLWGKHSVQD